MPHIVIEYTPHESNDFSVEHLMAEAHQAALATGLFDEAAIKVRVKAYDQALVGGRHALMMHVLIYLIEGRDAATKKALTQAVHDALEPLVPTYASVSVDARDLARDVYVKSY